MSYNDYLMPPEDDTCYETCPKCEGVGALYFQTEDGVVKEKCTSCDGVGEVEFEGDIDYLYERKFDK